jgi:hypothetical protein
MEIAKWPEIAHRLHVSRSAGDLSITPCTITLTTVTAYLSLSLSDQAHGCFTFFAVGSPDEAFSRRTASTMSTFDE